jgi:hypothetical protein
MGKRTKRKVHAGGVMQTFRVKYPEQRVVKSCEKKGMEESSER